MEFSINGKQALVIIWTLISLVVSLIVVLSFGYMYYPYGYFAPGLLSVALFFGILLIMTLPVYLLMALWQMLSRSDSA